MKKMKLALLLALGSWSAHAQYYDYSTATGWSTITNTYTNTINGCAVTPATAVTGSVTINLGRVNFNNVGGAHENRIVTPLGSLYDQQFTMDFDFNMTNTGTGWGAFLAALGSQNLNPGMAVPMVTCSAPSIMDAICVSGGTPSASSSINPSVTANVYDNGVLQPSGGSIPVTYGTIYYARLNVYGNERGELILFSNQKRTTRVGSFCFDVPRTVTGLGFLNHATSAGGGYNRRSSGWVDNTNIYRSDECCRTVINGPNVICDASRSALYTIETSGSSPMVSISPSDVIYSVNTDGLGFTVASWGTISSAPKEVTITVTTLCGCEEVTTTYIVYVYPGLDPAFNVSGLGSSGSNLTNFSGVSTAGMPGVIHTWQLFTSTSAGVPISSVRGPFTSTGAGSTFSVNATSPAPTLVTGQYYVMTHQMSFASGVCGVQDSARIIYISTKSMLDLGPRGYYTEAEMQKIIEAHEAGKVTEEQVKIFPNPTSDVITVEAVSEWQTISLVDANGKVLYTNGKPSKRQTIDLSAYAAGNYYIKIVSSQGTKLESVMKR